ncbi:MAG: hypothetical protein AB7E47_13865 [Desulfovibrionaceae bacterium]
MLTKVQKDRAVQLMQEYLAARNPNGKKCWEENIAFDAERREVIKTTLMPLLTGFLTGKTPLNEFKSGVDSTNKAHNCWGFRGFKGQMFFNILTNVALDPNGGLPPAKLDAALKAALTMPTTKAAAQKQVNDFAAFVRQLGEQYVAAGNKKTGCPKPGSIPFFLSYFWQIQGPDTWPVYYTSSVNALADSNLWSPGEDVGGTYLAFKHIHEELAQLFTKTGKQPFGLYEVEHVFWFKNSAGEVVETPPRPGDRARRQGGMEDDATELLPDSFVPPIIAILPRVALNEPGLATAAKNSGTSLERAFEKSINAAFTILGYTTELLGQGKGRVPDGTAVDYSNRYAIIWDAKVRADGYSIGTDDRTIREYIKTQVQKLKAKSLDNVYYAVISSAFKEDYDDIVSSLKMETPISEICLVQADALVAMVDLKLRDPQLVELGPTGLQRLLCNSGVLTGKLVREKLA